MRKDGKIMRAFRCRLQRAPGAPERPASMRRA